MTYVPGYEHDIFVSYAWVDNEAFEPAEHGWVDALYRTLYTSLAQKIGRKEAFSIWWDRQNLHGYREISVHIPDQVRNSAILLAILSPGYVASKQCLQELQAFVDNVKSLRNVKTGAAQRLFVVHMSPIDESRHKIPEVFRDLRKYQFWTLDRNRKPRTFGSPLPLYEFAEDRRYYYPLVSDLADDIVVKLDELKEAADGAAPRPPAELARRSLCFSRKTDDPDPVKMKCGVTSIRLGSNLPAGAYGRARKEFEQSFCRSRQCRSLSTARPFKISTTDVPEASHSYSSISPNQACPILQWRSRTSMS